MLHRSCENQHLYPRIEITAPTTHSFAHARSLGSSPAWPSSQITNLHIPMPTVTKSQTSIPLSSPQYMRCYVPSLLQVELNSSFWLVRLFRVGLRPLPLRSSNTCPAAQTCLILPHSREQRTSSGLECPFPCLSSLSYSYSPKSSSEKPSDTPS